MPQSKKSTLSVHLGWGLFIALLYVALYYVSTTISVGPQGFVDPLGASPLRLTSAYSLLVATSLGFMAAPGLILGCVVATWDSETFSLGSARMSHALNRLLVDVILPMVTVSVYRWLSDRFAEGTQSQTLRSLVDLTVIYCLLAASCDASFGRAAESTTARVFFEGAGLYAISILALISFIRLTASIRNRILSGQGPPPPRLP